MLDDINESSTIASRDERDEEREEERDEEDPLVRHFNSPTIRSRAMAPLMERKLPLWKRSIDILASGLGLLALAPCFYCSAP